MTDHTMSKHEAAMAAVNAAESSARVTGAMLVLDALDAHAADLSSFDRYDFAYATWQVMIDGDTPIADADIVKVACRVSAHLPGDTVVDLVDAMYGEYETRIRLDDETALTWLPHDGVLILSIPQPDGRLIADVVLGRRPALIT